MYKLLLLSLITTLLACHDTQSLRGDEQEKLTTSRALWTALKLEHGGTYSYQRQYSSWVGWRFTNLFGVQADTVVYRSYSYYEDSSDSLAGPSNSWTEYGDDVGSNVDGFPAKTIDELYNECEINILTLEPEGYEVSLVIDDSGILQSCTYLEYGCADDCGGGPTIYGLVMGPWAE